MTGGINQILVLQQIWRRYSQQELLHCTLLKPQEIVVFLKELTANGSFFIDLFRAGTSI